MLFDLERAQELLDMGYSKTQVAEKMGVHHSKICRLFDRGLLEDYVAFDYPPTKDVLVRDVDDWLDTKDALDNILYNAFDKVVIIENNNNTTSLSRYVRENYKSLISVINTKGLFHLMEQIKIQCDACGEAHDLNGYYQVPSDRGRFMGVQCRKCVSSATKRYFRNNPDIIKSYVLKRKISEGILPSEVVRKHQFKCCSLSGNKNYTVDHFVAVNTGHCGNYFENLSPLTLALNSSKGNKNPYEWFSECVRLERGLFEKEVNRLARLNMLTSIEYRQFVYWCYNNKRSIDEIKRDQRHSIEIWREAIGKHFPLPRYVYEVGFLTEDESEVS